MAFKLTAADYVEYLEITAVEIEKSGDYVTAVSYTHLDVYKRQPS